MKIIANSSWQRGLTLAEIAMAMFIIGVGVLSILTVYLQRERTASITAQQALAHRLAAEMAQHIQIRQSPEIRFENAIGVRCTPSPSANAPGATTALNAQVRAVNEVACWQENVAAELPSGAGSISLDESIVPPNYAVTVSWSQPRGGLASYTVRVAAMIAQPPQPANAPPKPNVARAAN